jgi:hypothetical protein
MKINDYLTLDREYKYAITPNTMHMAVNMRNLGHFSSICNGTPFIFMDQMRECKATPMITTAFMRAMKR